MCKAIWQLCWNDECDFFHVSLSVTEPCEWGYELVAGSPDLRCHRTGKTIASESKTIEEVRGNCLACPVLPKGEPTLMRMIVECLKSPEALLPASATDKVYQWEVKHNGVIEIIIGIEGADDFKKAVEEFDSATTGAGTEAQGKITIDNLKESGTVLHRENFRSTVNELRNQLRARQSSIADGPRVRINLHM